ncbi:MAG: ornithine cyclodeaminase family protein [Acidobacteriota bacterium]|nr:MAG: ornithine cyclodeaminase family protein [Acidobacteriota bacterium]
MALFLTEQDVTALLTMEETLPAVEEVFRLQATGAAVNEPRRRLRAAGAVLQVMSGAVAGIGEFAGLLGLKAYTVTRSGVRFYVLLFDAGSGELLALIEADKLGQMRTGAASGIATRYLARPGAKTVGIFGTGWQAESQLAAVCAVRPVEEVLVYSRSPERRARFCERMSAGPGISRIEPVERPEEAAGAEILITITSSREPVLFGKWIGPGAHINAAGGNSLLRRELDDEAVARASLIAVDSLDQARLEAGELITAVEKGLLTWEKVRELRHVVNGDMPGRKSEQEITIFKSLGIAIEDIAAAAVVYRKGVAQQAGRELK